MTLSGESSQVLAEYAEQVETILSRVEGFKNVQSEATQGDREVHSWTDTVHSTLGLRFREGVLDCAGRRLDRHEGALKHRGAVRSTPAFS